LTKTGETKSENRQKKNAGEEKEGGGRSDAGEEARGGRRGYIRWNIDQVDPFVGACRK
jgi:hypothetical protein